MIVQFQYCPSRYPLHASHHDYICLMDRTLNADKPTTTARIAYARLSTTLQSLFTLSHIITIALALKPPSA